LKFNIEDCILFEDNDYFAINKPPGLSSLEDRNDPLDVLKLAKAYSDDAQICHRLDRDTSGVLLIAKNPEAYRHASIQFEMRKMGKLYHAVVDGIHDFKDELVDAPILKRSDGTVKIDRDGKPAQTSFSTINTFRNHTLIACRPITGRTHQIRIHLTVLKASITGDLTYGGRPFYLSSVKRKFNLKKTEEEKPVMSRMALHAFSLEFKDLAEKTIKIEAPYPKDMRALIRQLELNS
jgi:23S rRNA pseudouridine955/2504/2580 synthase